MAVQTLVEYRVDVRDGEGSVLSVGPERRRWSSALGIYARFPLSLPGTTFTALAPPTGCKAVMILPGAATSLVLKGVTGDTGIPILPASNSVGLDLIIPLGASPTIGIYNGGSTATVEIIYL